MYTYIHASLRQGSSAARPRAAEGRRPQGAQAASLDTIIINYVIAHLLLISITTIIIN